MNKIILIFIENDDFEKEIDKRYLKKIKNFIYRKIKKRYEVRIFSNKNLKTIKKWIKENALEKIITNPNPFNSAKTKIDENMEIYTLNNFSKIFKTPNTTKNIKTKKKLLTENFVLVIIVEQGFASVAQQVEHSPFKG